ncbi:hypothetical protein AN189_15295 [Loktanella sp. 3ANDIMAR09]|nr:hypothetical protein AN189_15295 [Loktanella sp. 3ANDIMAR09]
MRENLAAFGRGLSRGMEAYAHRKSRIDQMERLNAKTDAELAEMGLRRQDIARHVFADLMNVY